MKGKWKGKAGNSNKKKKGSAVLQKYMVAVGEFVKSKSSIEEEAGAEDDRGFRFVKKKSRKELRKEKRKLKKLKMKNHYEGKKITSLPTDDGEHLEIPADKKSQLQKKEKVTKEVSKKQSNKSSNASAEKSETSKTTTSSSKTGKKKTNKLQESRKMALLEANEQEDREIKKLERCLRLNKRKNKKSLPQSFMADGLDYILGVLDSGTSATGMYDSEDDMDMAKENFEKLDKNDSQLSDEDEESGGDEMASEDDDDDDDMGSYDDENEDEVINDEEADDEEMEHELDESDAADSEEENEGDADSDGENEGDAEEEADAKTSGSNSGAVSSQPKYLFLLLSTLIYCMYK